MSTPPVHAVLREASRSDVPALLGLERTLFGAEAWSVTVVTEALVCPGRVVVVAEADREVTGYAVARVTAEVADLERLAVAPASRRSGLATALLQEVRERVRAGGADRLLLEVGEGNAGARAFYAEHGAVQLDRRRRYYRDGSDALVLELPLGDGDDDVEENGG